MHIRAELGKLGHRRAKVAKGCPKHRNFLVAAERRGFCTGHPALAWKASLSPSRRIRELLHERASTSPYPFVSTNPGIFLTSTEQSVLEKPASCKGMSCSWQQATAASPPFIHEPQPASAATGHERTIAEAKGLLGRT